jgi:hypothetical protein
VTLEAGTALPAEWPREWLRFEASAALVRFVHSRFDRDRLLQDVRRVFGDSARVEASPMSLRAIFVALAREARKAA